MFSVDKHLDSYRWSDFKKRKKWLYKKWKGDDDSKKYFRQTRYFNIEKYPKQPVDNENQYYRGFGSGKPAQHEIRYNYSTGEYIMEPHNYWAEHVPKVDKRIVEFNSRGLHYGQQMKRKDDRPVAKDQYTKLMERAEKAYKKRDEDRTDADWNAIDKFINAYEWAHGVRKEGTQIGKYSGREMVTMPLDVGLYGNVIKLNRAQPVESEHNTPSVSREQSGTMERQKTRQISWGDLTQEARKVVEGYYDQMKEGEIPVATDEYGEPIYNIPGNTISINGKRGFDFANEYYDRVTRGRKAFDETAIEYVPRQGFVHFPK